METEIIWHNSIVNKNLRSLVRKGMKTSELSSVDAIGW